MSLEQAFVNGMVKRAFDMGMAPLQVLEFLNKHNIDPRLAGAGVGAVGGGLMGGWKGAVGGASVGAGGGQWLKEQDQIINPRAVEALEHGMQGRVPAGGQGKADDILHVLKGVTNPDNGANSITGVGHALERGNFKPDGSMDVNGLQNGMNELRDTFKGNIGKNDPGFMDAVNRLQQGGGHQMPQMPPQMSPHAPAPGTWHKPAPGYIN